MENVVKFLKDVQDNCMEYNKDLSKLSAEEQYEIIKDGSSYLAPEEKILEKLKNAKKNKKPLSIKFGVDPTGTELHLGHIVPLTLLNRLQRMGHKIVFLVGDFTAIIGDPSGNLTSRRNLTRKDIENNFKNYKKQVGKFIDFSRAETVFNSTWLHDLKLPELIDILKKINLVATLGRSDLKQKVDNLSEFTYADILYPIIMGFDSVVLSPDIEIGGEDQLSNFYMCRHIMEIKGMEPECIITTGLIDGIDENSEKMSKTSGNYIAVAEKAEVMFEKIAYLPDRLVPSYYKWLTELNGEHYKKLKQAVEGGEIDLVTLKELLAYIITSRLYGKDESIKAQEEYNRKLIKSFNVTNVRLAKGSVMNITEFISAATGEVCENTCSFISKGAVKVLDKTGNVMSVIEDGWVDINSIAADEFYIKISDKYMLKAVK